MIGIVKESLIGKFNTIIMKLDKSGRNSTLIFFVTQNLYRFFSSLTFIFHIKIFFLSEIEYWKIKTSTL